MQEKKTQVFANSQKFQIFFQYFFENVMEFAEFMRNFGNTENCRISMFYRKCQKITRTPPVFNTGSSGAYMIQPHNILSGVTSPTGDNQDADGVGGSRVSSCGIFQRPERILFLHWGQLHATPSRPAGVWQPANLYSPYIMTRLNYVTTRLCMGQL